MDVELVPAGNAINLRYGFIRLEKRNHLIEGIRSGFQLKIAGYGAAYFLGVDDGGVFFDDAPLFQGLNPGPDSHPGNTDLLADVRIRHAGIFYQQPDDLLIQLVETVEKHGKLLS